MKKIKAIEKALLILIGIFSLNSCSSNTKENDIQKEGLIGKVMSFQTLMFEVEDKFGEIRVVKNINSNSDPIKLNSYDENGFLTETNYYKPTSSRLDVDRLPEINSSGKYNEDEWLVKIIGKTIYKYDENNLKIEKRNYDKFGSLEIKIIYNYDENYNQIAKELYNKNGDLVSNKKFKYDGNNNKILEEMFSSNGLLKSKAKYKYDEKGNRTNGIFFKEDDSLDSKLIYNIIEDKNGKQEEMSYFNSDGESIKKIVFKKDVNGYSLGIDEYYSDGSLNFKSENKNDSKGNIIESILSIPKKKLKSKNTYEYEFDEKGNWIKKIKYKNDIAETMTIRTFQYY